MKSSFLENHGTVEVPKFSDTQNVGNLNRGLSIQNFVQNVQIEWQIV